MARTVAIFIQQPAELSKPPGQALLPFPYKFTHEKKKKKTYNKREAIPFCMYDSMNQPKNQKNPKNVHSCSGKQNKWRSMPQASETSSLFRTDTGAAAGNTVPAIPGHQYCCSRSTPGSCHTISGCFRRRGTLVSALSARK